MQLKTQTKNMAQLKCSECGEVVEHPVGENGQKTLCDTHIREHLEQGGLIG